MSIDYLPSTATSRTLGYEEPEFDHSCFSEVDIKVEDLDGLFDDMANQKSEPFSFSELSRQSSCLSIRNSLYLELCVSSFHSQESVQMSDQLV